MIGPVLASTAVGVVLSLIGVCLLGWQFGKSRVTRREVAELACRFSIMEEGLRATQFRAPDRLSINGKRSVMATRGEVELLAKIQKLRTAQSAGRS